MVIATPDHWHAYPVVMAAKAGKDIYCEKPLSATIHEARAMVAAVRENQRVFQTGSMQRSDSAFWKGCTLVRNGAIGEVKEVYVSVGGPSKWCDLPEEPADPGSTGISGSGPPMRPYNSVLSPRGIHDHFPNWRNYREYSGGMMTDWGAHHFDIAQWGLGMDESGPVEILPPRRQRREAPHLQVRERNRNVPRRPRRLQLRLRVRRHQGQGVCRRGRFKAEPEGLMNEKFESLPVQLYRSNNHYKDFVDCVRSRQKPICDIEVRTRSVSVCHLGNLAYWHNRRLQWDPAKEQFLGDAEANTSISREVRGAWKVSAPGCPGASPGRRPGRRSIARARGAPTRGHSDRLPAAPNRAGAHRTVTASATRRGGEGVSDRALPRDISTPPKAVGRTGADASILPGSSSPTPRAGSRGRRSGTAARSTATPPGCRLPDSPGADLGRAPLARPAHPR